MIMKIQFGSNEVVLSNFSPSVDSLNFTASASVTDFDTLKLLETYKGAIKYFEDDVEILEYEDYTAGFSCIYILDNFAVSLKKIGSTELTVKGLQEQIDEIVTEVIPAILEM